MECHSSNSEYLEQSLLGSAFFISTIEIKKRWQGLKIHPRKVTQENIAIEKLQERKLYVVMRDRWKATLENIAYGKLHVVMRELRKVTLENIAYGEVTREKVTCSYEGSAESYTRKHCIWESYMRESCM
jgi:hypothetical protein